MKTVAKIIALHGGLEALKAKYIRIENPPFMRLVIEHIGVGPRGFPLVSVVHYGEQHGDAMRDPEMTFEVDDVAWGPITFQQDYTGLYQEAVFVRNGKTYIRPALVRELKAFAQMWDRNLREQKFLEAYQRQIQEV